MTASLSLYYALHLIRSWWEWIISNYSTPSFHFQTISCLLFILKQDADLKHSILYYVPGILSTDVNQMHLVSVLTIMSWGKLIISNKNSLLQHIVFRFPCYILRDQMTSLSLKKRCWSLPQWFVFSFRKCGPSLVTDDMLYRFNSMLLRVHT